MTADSRVIAHESAHAGAALALGLDVRGVSIVPDLRTEGRCDVAYRDDQARERVLVLMTGLSEPGREPNTDPSTDGRNVRALCEEHGVELHHAVRAALKVRSAPQFLLYRRVIADALRMAPTLDGHDIEALTRRAA